MDYLCSNSSTSNIPQRVRFFRMPGRAAGVLRRCRAPSTNTHRRFITLGAVLQIDDTDFPFPLVESAESVKELLLAMKPKITKLFGWGLALEAVVLLALDLKCVPDGGIPAEYGLEDAVEIGEVQRVRHSYQPNDHWVDIAENCSQNQSFEGCCWHVFQPTSTPDFVLLSKAVVFRENDTFSSGYLALIPLLR